MRLNSKSWTQALVPALGAALFVDLFLTWHSTSVSVAGTVVVDAGSSAWAGWGAVAGALLVVLLVWEALRLAGAAATQRATAEAVSLWLAIAAAVFTAIEFFAGTVSTVTGPGVVVDVHARQWPAYLGLVLAGLLVLAAVVRVARPRPAEEPPRHLVLGVR